MIGDEDVAHIVGVEQERAATITVCGQYIYGAVDFDADADRCGRCTEAAR